MKKLLLHVCCAPCSTSVIERLKAETDYKLTLFFSNSNILPESEYVKRKEALINFISEVHPDIEIIFDGYNPNQYFKAIKNFESLGEGTKRCEACIEFRLTKTAQLAKKEGFDAFSTTLTVSPHKNAKFINCIGNQLAVVHGVEFYEADFKKRNGYLRSIELCKLYNIYRQTYCGCNFLKEGEI